MDLNNLTMQLVQHGRTIKLRALVAMSVNIWAEFHTPRSHLKSMSTMSNVQADSRKIEVH